MTDFQIKQLAIVAIVALTMAGILVYWVLDARRRRAEDRAAEALRLYVRIAFIAPQGEGADLLMMADLLDAKLDSAGIGHVEDLDTGQAVATGEGLPPPVKIGLDVVLTAGRAALPTLKRALRDAGIPADARLEYQVNGIMARERLGR